MTRRYYPAFYDKLWEDDRFVERFVVIDGNANCAVSEPKAYHLANNEAGKRNEGTFTLRDRGEALLD